MNCTKKRDALAELMFCLSKLSAFLVFSLTSPSSMLVSELTLQDGRGKKTANLV